MPTSSFNNREKLKKRFEERICRNCKGYFYVYKTIRARNRSNSIVRTSKSYTCSKRCSIRYLALIQDLGPKRRRAYYEKVRSIEKLYKEQQLTKRTA